MQVSVPRVQPHPEPLIAVAVSPEGKVSTTVTVLPATIGPGPALPTVTVYVSPVSPCLNCVECDFVIVRSGAWVMGVTAFAVSLDMLVSPPPETVAVLVTEDGALLATLTVTVIVG